MLIFTPRTSFDHETVQSVNVLSGFVDKGKLKQARLQVISGSHGNINVFYGEEAFSVLAQLQEAGYFTPTQRGMVEAALRDEMEMAAALPAQED